MYLSSEKNTLAADRSDELEGVSHIITDVLYPAFNNIMLDGSTALSAVTTGPNDSTVTSSKYGTVQSDGFMYYYTNIKGCNPIKDPRVGGYFGSQRHIFRSIQKMEQASAHHGKEVWSIDGKEYLRFLSIRGTKWTNDANGFGLNIGNTTGEFFEFIGYFSHMNFIHEWRNNRTVKYTIDDSSESSRISGASVTTSLNGRYVSGASSVFCGGAALGIHTVKVRGDGSDDVYGHGMELIAQDTTSTATKSQMQIPSQRVITYGKKFTVADTPHYNPFALAGDGTTAVAIGNTTSHGKVADGWAGSTATYFDSTLDTTTSLGLSTWETGGDFYRPVNGGRIVKWVDSSGNIKTSVNMMPPTATGMELNATDAALPTSHSWTTVFQPKFSSSGIDHSQAEVAKTFHFREFGNGAANGGTTGTFPDCSMLSGQDDFMYVMDDGLTSIAADDYYSYSNYGLRRWGNGDVVFLVFIGTGLTSIGRNYTRTVAQNLPYGTHVFKQESYGLSSNGDGGDWYIDGVLMTTFSGAAGIESLGENGILELSFHQPKMPPIPEDAVVIADYMLMADFVGVSGTNEQRYISKGVRRAAVTRDWGMNGSSAPVFRNNHTDRNPEFMSLETAAETTYSNPFFATRIVSQIENIGSGGAAHTTSWAGSTSSMTKVEGGGNAEDIVITPAATIGPNVLSHVVLTGGYHFFGSQIAIPTHTSSHYQSFETPWSRELVGGDRNMEQTNIVVTPDGKTWDEVTRDTGYLGDFRWRAAITSGLVGPNDKAILDDHRGMYYGSRINLGIKDFAWGYNQLICLVDGEYIVHRCDVWKSDATTTDASIHINGGLVWVSMSNTGGHWCPTSIHLHCQLKRGDYVEFEGSMANTNDSNSYPFSHWWVSKA